MTSCQSLERTTILPPADRRTYHDSGATSLVFHSMDVFEKRSMKSCGPRSIHLTDTSRVMADKIGEVAIPLENATIRLKDVLYVPGLGYNLVSVGRLADNG